MEAKKTLFNDDDDNAGGIDLSSINTAAAL